MFKGISVITTLTFLLLVSGAAGASEQLEAPVFKAGETVAPFPILGGAQS